MRKGKSEMLSEQEEARKKRERWRDFLLCICKGRYVAAVLAAVLIIVIGCFMRDQSGHAACAYVLVWDAGNWIWQCAKCWK